MNQPPVRSDMEESLVLNAILDSSGKKIFLKDLQSITGLERGIIKRCIENLRESGIDIDGRGGFSIDNLPDIVNTPVVLCGLKSRILGRNVFSYKRIGSTNETAQRLAESGAPEGTLVVADRQTRGRGRLGRKWHSPPGLGLYFSLVLRPIISLDLLPGLSLVAALSLCRVIERLDNLHPQIKWPNDCLIDSQKAAGILTEISAELDRIDYAVMGIGINVNHQKKDFPLNLRSRSTSLALKTGVRQNRAGFLREFLFEFEKDYHNFVRYGIRFMGRALVERSSVLNRRIIVRFGRKKFTGTAIGFDQNGALRLKTKDGVTTVSAGEVTLRR